METCNMLISDFGELMEIWLYDDSNATFALPFTLFRPTVIVGGQHPELTLSDTPAPIALLADFSDTDSLPEIKESTETAGVKSVFTLDFTFSRNYATESQFSSQLEALRSGWYHLLLVYSSGERRIVRATPDTFRFEYQESDGLSKGTITIENISGAQHLTAPSQS